MVIKAAGKGRGVSPKNDLSCSVLQAEGGMEGRWERGVGALLGQTWRCWGRP